MLDCIVVGDVMMDVVLRSNYRILSSLNVEGTNYFEESIVQPGGSGNVASAIAYLSGTSAFLGKAGDDVYGHAYAQDLESRQVATHIIYDASFSTGVTVSIVEPAGHRTLLVARGANDKLTPREVETRLATIGASTFVYLSGYSLVNSPQREAVLETVKFANKKSSRIVFDVASSNLARSHSNIFTSAIESCHFLCANLDEASVLANGLPIAEYARRQSRNGRIVIVKMGANGCLVAEDGKSMEVPGFKVTSIDTTGAGDSFLGAVLYCLSRKIPLVKAALFGNWFASQLTSGIGARNYPEIEKTQQEYERLVA